MKQDEKKRSDLCADGYLNLHPQLGGRGDGLVCRESKSQARIESQMDGWMEGAWLVEKKGGILNAEDDPFPMVPVLGS